MKSCPKLWDKNLLENVSSETEMDEKWTPGHLGHGGDLVHLVELLLQVFHFLAEDFSVLGGVHQELKRTFIVGCWNDTFKT
jgi:hypothetical protein